jgi:hypothetical protein
LGEDAPLGDIKEHTILERVVGAGAVVGRKWRQNLTRRRLSRRCWLLLSCRNNFFRSSLLSLQHNTQWNAHTFRNARTHSIHSHP